MGGVGPPTHTHLIQPRVRTRARIKLVLLNKELMMLYVSSLVFARGMCSVRLDGITFLTWRCTYITSKELALLLLGSTFIILDRRKNQK